TLHETVYKTFRKAGVIFISTDYMMVRKKDVILFSLSGIVMKELNSSQINEINGAGFLDTLNKLWTDYIFDPANKFWTDNIFDPANKLWTDNIFDPIKEAINKK